MSLSHPWIAVTNFTFNSTAFPLKSSSARVRIELAGSQSSVRARGYDSFVRNRTVDCCLAEVKGLKGIDCHLFVNFFLFLFFLILFIFFFFLYIVSIYFLFLFLFFFILFFYSLFPLLSSVLPHFFV